MEQTAKPETTWASESIEYSVKALKGNRNRLCWTTASVEEQRWWVWLNNHGNWLTYSNGSPCPELHYLHCLRSSWTSICYNRYFSFNGLSTFLWMHLILSRHVIILSQGMLSLYLFSHEISISLMLSQPSFNFCVVHGYAYFSSLPFWYLMHHTCYASILCIAYLISAPTAQGLGFPLCIQYR